MALSPIHTILHYSTHYIFSLCYVFTGCLVTASNAVASWSSVLPGCYLSHNSTRRCYATTYNGDSSASLASPTGRLYTTSDGYVSQLLTADSWLSTDWLVFRFSRYSFYIHPQTTPLPKIPLLFRDVVLLADRTENTVPNGTSIAYVAWCDVFHCCVTVYCATALKRASAFREYVTIITYAGLLNTCLEFM
jgi:hypothetical protein